jgi:hypothetical protein
MGDDTPGRGGSVGYEGSVEVLMTDLAGGAGGLGGRLLTV